MQVEQVSEDDIASLVKSFYGRVRDDKRLAHVFEAQISDWNEHLEIMKSFWSSVILTSGKYKGHPMRVHMEMPGIEHHHFDLWLDHFRAAAQHLFEDRKAQVFITRANRIAESFKLGLNFERNTLETPESGKELHHAH